MCHQRSVVLQRENYPLRFPKFHQSHSQPQSLSSLSKLTGCPTSPMPDMSDASCSKTVPATPPYQPWLESPGKIYQCQWDPTPSPELYRTTGWQVNTQPSKSAANWNIDICNRSRGKRKRKTNQLLSLLPLLPPFYTDVVIMLCDRSVCETQQHAIKRKTEQIQK